MAKQEDDDPIDAYVGFRLKQRRSELEMTQEALGAALGVTAQQIQKYERGVNRLGAGRLYRVAAILGVTISYFYDGFAPSGDGGKLHEAPATPFEHENLGRRDTIDVVNAFNGIRDAKVRRKAIDLIRAVAEVNPL